MTEWERRRQEWVESLSDAELFKVVGAVARNSYLDENGGDRGERSDAIEWLTTRGKGGYDWGIPAQYARDLGLLYQEEGEECR
jgi:hypothetical protein